MRLQVARVYVGIASASLIVAVLLLLIGNWAAEAWLQRHPSILMSEVDRINENTRAVREKMISPEKATLWYDLKSPDEVKPMWDEFYRTGAVFESYVHFRAYPLVGKYYGTTEAGYRLSRNPGPWPPDSRNFNVFFFGGSTSFGVGPYWATVASYLQEIMNASGKSAPVCVPTWWCFSTGSTISASLTASLRAGRCSRRTSTKSTRNISGRWLAMG
jgi:hypothetical protein